MLQTRRKTLDSLSCMSRMHLTRQQLSFSTAPLSTASQEPGEPPRDSHSHTNHRHPPHNGSDLCEATIVQTGCVRTRGGGSNTPSRPFPTMFMLPGLDARAFHDSSAAPHAAWAHELEKNTCVILGEYNALREAGMASDYHVAPGERTLHTDGKWDWHSLLMKGQWNQAVVDCCPVTTALLKQAPLMTGFPLAYAFFSTLKAQSSIAAHYGACNLRLRGHLPLITTSPGQSRLRVGDCTREWETGKLIIFDDTFEHEAHNESSDIDRVVLLFDIWHPGLYLDERNAMCRMFEDMKQTKSM